MIKITPDQDVEVDGVLYKARPMTGDGCPDCAFNSDQTTCGEAPCTNVMRVDGHEVIFVREYPNEATDDTRISRWLDAGSEMDDLCATAESMFGQFASQMSTDDLAARNKVIIKARDMIDDFFRSED